MECERECYIGSGSDTVGLVQWDWYSETSTVGLVQWDWYSETGTVGLVGDGGGMVRG